MNRKRDLENLSKLYEGYTGEEPDNIGFPTTNRQKKAVNSLLRRGMVVQNDFTRQDQREGFDNIILVKGDNLETNRMGSTPVFVDNKGMVDGEDYKNYIRQNFEDVVYDQDENNAYNPGIVQKNQATEDENPLMNDLDEEEFKKGDRVIFLNTPSDLKDIKSGMAEFPSPKFTRGKIVHVQDGVAFVDQGIGMHVVPLEDLKRDEEAEDLGPNQQPETWGDEAMGSEEPGQTSQRFAQDTPDDPASGGSPNIDDPDEEDEFNTDPYYNREEDLRSKGIDPDAEDPDADEKGKEERNKDEDQEEDEMDVQKAINVINNYLKDKVHGDKSHANKEVRDNKKLYIKNLIKKRNETKKESFNSRGDRDMTILAENYLNIKHYE